MPETIDRAIALEMSACGLGDCQESPNPQAGSQQAGSTTEALKQAEPYIVGAVLLISLYIAWRVSSGSK